MHVEPCGAWTSFLSATATLQVLLTTRHPAIAVALFVGVAAGVRKSGNLEIWKLGIQQTSETANY